MTPIKKEIGRLLSSVLADMPVALSQAEIESSFEIPNEEKFGDLSVNVAMKAAKTMKKQPRVFAEDLKKKLLVSVEKSVLKDRIEKISVEGPGFINFYFSQSETARVVFDVKNRGGDFGKPEVEKKKILLEFVSANPTGPLTVAHGRQAALGDSLARILRFCGHTVSTEYYNNDEGVQIETLGKSLALRVEELSGKKTEMPENYYRGEYLIGTAKKFVDKYGVGAPLVGALPGRGQAPPLPYADFAKNDILADIKKDLADFDIRFDNIYSQEALGKSGKVEKTLEELKKKEGAVYESEGAWWLRSTAWGDDKDRVLIKSDGSYTYLTPDIAYHHEKFSRGFERLINILGPDHHGYIARLKASQAALGHDPERVRILIAQLVTLYEGQKQVRMSTRAGEFVTLRQILDEVGKDAGRFFFLMRKFDAHLDFDLALAKSQTPENPVFYIQYAHARIESIKNAYGVGAPLGGALPGRGQAPPLPWGDEKYLKLLSNPYEMRLLRLLSQYESNVLGAERTLEPYRVTAYLMELAGAFHKFYAENRVVGEDLKLTEARMMLVIATQAVIRSGLSLLGVSAPLKM